MKITTNSYLIIIGIFAILYTPIYIVGALMVALGNAIMKFGDCINP